MDRVPLFVQIIPLVALTSSSFATTVVVDGHTLRFDKAGNLVAETPDCGFVYSHKIREIALQAAHQKLGGTFNRYKIASGAIAYKDHIEVMFHPILVEGENDAADFIVLIDPCTHVVQKTYFKVVTR